MLKAAELYAMHKRVLMTLSVVKDPRPEPDDFNKLPVHRQMYWHNMATLINEYKPVKYYAVVTPWLDHGKEWFIRFVGTLGECTAYHIETYGGDTDYADVVELPDATHTYTRGHIIPRTR